MSRLVWDKIGERLYETGVDRGVLYPMSADGSYPKGVAWNGLTSVSESPSGAESNPIYADNLKYLDLRSDEEFGFTIGAYTYPDEFAECDGSAEPVEGLEITQQARSAFGFSYRSLIGNDTEGRDYGYKLHLVYNAMANPSEKERSTVNDSPEAGEFSWECSTTPVVIAAINPKTSKPYRPTAHLVVNSTKIGAEKLAALEALLYGSTDGEGVAHMPSPDEVIALLSAEG